MKIKASTWGLVAILSLQVYLFFATATFNHAHHPNSEIVVGIVTVVSLVAFILSVLMIASIHLEPWAMKMKPWVFKLVATIICLLWGSCSIVDDFTNLHLPKYARFLFGFLALWASIFSVHIHSKHANRKKTPNG